MDATIEYLWSLQPGIPTSAADWAITLLEAGWDAPAIRQLTCRNLTDRDREGLTRSVLEYLGRSELVDTHVLSREYERASIGDYLTGSLPGGELIQRCCDLYWSDEKDDPGRAFWISLADDADQHGGQGVCIKYDFIGVDFDTALRSAILNSGRPLPESKT